MRVLDLYVPSGLIWPQHTVKITWDLHDDWADLEFRIKESLRE